jgi:ketosteroid isomerase-like protein
MKAKLLLLTLTLAAVPVPGPAAAAPSRAENPATLAVAELLAADRRFGKESETLRGAEGLTNMFADDIVLFAVPVPGFARGKSAAAAALLSALGSPNGTTRWSPIRGGVSADGKQGFTFGYMTTEEAGEPIKLAKYVSYWVRTDAGWRVRLFKRVPRPAGETTAEMPPSVPARWRPKPAAASWMREYEQSLRAREKSFSDESQRIGLGPAFARFGRADAVNVGGGSEYVVGARSIGESQGRDSPLRWEADQGVLVAGSGDLGVTWGYLHRNGPTPPGRLAQIPLFTIWKREGRKSPWLYIAE